MPTRIQIIILAICSFSLSVRAQQTNGFNISRYDIEWDSASRNEAGSMPCGGGDIGLNVWIEHGELFFYIARSGAFDQNNALLKLGRMHFRFQPSILDEARIRQKLLLEDGSVLITTSSKKADGQIRIWVDVNRPVIHVDMDMNHPVGVEAVYENWRTTDRVIRRIENNGNSYKWASEHAPGGEVVTTRDSIRSEGRRIIFYHRNPPGPDVFDVTVHQQGLDSVKSLLNDPLRNLQFGGSIEAADVHVAGRRNTDGAQGSGWKPKSGGGESREWALASDHPSKSMRLQIYCHTSCDNGADQWEQGLRQFVQASRASERGAWDKSRAWWHEFWGRSFIEVYPQHRDAQAIWEMGRNYQLFRYMLGCNAHGDYPTKFNGGLFTVDPSLTDSSIHATPDFRNWGGGIFTAQNQRLVYWPMLRSGDFDLLRVELDFYKRLLPVAEARTRVYWGHAGASFTEQLDGFGLPNNAEYGWDMPAGHDRGVEYNAWLEYTWDTVLEFCLMMLDLHDYSGADIHDYLPFVESCVRFFDQHYQYLAKARGRKILDDEGHLVLFPGSAAETYKMVYNSTSTIAGLQTIVRRLLALPDSYLDKDARKEFDTLLDRLPGINFRTIDSHTTLSPGRLWERVNNTETPQLYPLFPWGVYGLGRPGLDTALNTWKFDPDVLKWRGSRGWRQDNIFAARLGLADEAAALTLEKLLNAPQRFPAFWGPGYDWTPDHNWGGSGMIGLQEMLLQADGRKIFLFPAWPADRDVHFRLWAPGHTIVEARLSKGKITELTVNPEERRKDIILPPKF